tara:strand:+ start:178 stop:330 length:153 start_codon:yes stop_codon:yes gene_type:complete
MIDTNFVAENIMGDEASVSLVDLDNAGFSWYPFELVTALIFIRSEDYLSG